MNDLPIACTLSPAELRDRQSGLHARLAAAVLERRELPDGHAFRFEPASQLLEDLLRFIDQERQCCAFLGFRLVVEPGSGPLWLELTAPGAGKEVVGALLA